MKLLSDQEMAQKYEELSQTNSKPPYFYQITKGQQILYYLGFHHSNDPSDPAYTKLKNLWKQFLDITDHQNDVVLVEGGDWTPRETEEASIKHGSESEFTTYLAHKAKIKCISPEPDEMKEVNQLLKKFSKEEIMYYYFARMALQWIRTGKKGTLKKFIWNSSFRTYQELTKWPDFDYSFENCIKFHDQFHDHPFNENDRDCFYKDSNPYESKVCSASSKIRDEHIVNEIVKLWHEGKNIFIVYGSGHAIKQEPALKEMLSL